MSIGLQLNLRQTQQLVMTPQLQQAIKLLAMSNLELAEFVAAEIEKNPLLARQDAEEAPAPDADDPAPMKELSEATDIRTEDHRLLGETFDTGTENLSETSPSDGPCPLTGPTVQSTRSPTGSGGAPADGDFTAAAERVAARVGLRDHLLNQLGQMPADDAVTAALSLILVDELDEHGYLRTGIADLADRQGVDAKTMQAALLRLQSCEPTGVGARSIGECLGLQLKEIDRLDPAMQALTENLDLLGNGNLRKLRALCAVSDEDFADMIAELRELDPRPCAAFAAVETVTVVPDILMRRQDWGGWHLELNPETLPRVLMDNSYAASVSGMGCERTEKFISECRADAAWLIKSLDQRAKTILRVAAEIVRHQERFFEEGITGLQPLTLQTVADAIDMHESTASRVTANKYIATNRGIFELKFFFTNAVGGGEGEDVAAAAVRHRIKTMVQAESPTSVLSDDAIVDGLRAEGIDIARRTVAKYRKSLNIPSSFERKRMHEVTAQL